VANETLDHSSNLGAGEALQLGVDADSIGFDVPVN